MTGSAGRAGRFGEFGSYVERSETGRGEPGPRPADDGKRWSCADRFTIVVSLFLREGAGRETRNIFLRAGPLTHFSEFFAFLARLGGLGRHFFANLSQDGAKMAQDGLK